MRLSGSPRLELLGDFALGSVKCSEEEAAAAFKIVGDNSAVLELKAHRRLDEFRRHFEQFLSERNEFFDRKTGMPFVHRLGERVGDAGTDANQSNLLDAEHAHRINQGLMPDLAPVESGDFYFVDAADAEEGVRKLLAIVQDRIPKRFGLDPIREIHVLCPMNRGGLGARSLNIELQNALNPPGEIRVERFGWTFCPGDKVMQVENDYDKDVYNGDLGVVSRIDMEEGELSVDFDGREVTYGFGELDELMLAYATTIHKSQGSEYPAVVIPLSTQHYPMLQRNLVYTGVTRGKRLEVLVGLRKALAIAVKGSRARRRWSKLREWLIGGDRPGTRRAES